MKKTPWQPCCFKMGDLLVMVNGSVVERQDEAFLRDLSGGQQFLDFQALVAEGLEYLDVTGKLAGGNGVEIAAVIPALIMNLVIGEDENHGASAGVEMGRAPLFPPIRARLETVSSTTIKVIHGSFTRG
jgi:hypothetical protein